MIEFPSNVTTQLFLLELGVDEPSEVNYEKPLNSMSNSNYLFNILDSSRKLVVRVDNDSNSKIIDRGIEKFNSIVVESLGIGPKICFSDGYKISEYINNSSIYDKSSNAHMKAACRSLAIMHNSDSPFQNNFDPIRMGLSYLSGVKDHDAEFELVYDDINNLSNLSSRLFSANGEKVPCQIDLVPENLLYANDEDKIYIIDQEYSGMFFREWDLACLASETDMDKLEESDFIRQYKEESGHNVSMELYYFCKSLCNLLWSAWALYYEETEGSMMDYFRLRYCKYLLSLREYKKIRRDFNEQT